MNTIDTYKTKYTPNRFSSPANLLLSVNNCAHRRQALAVENAMAFFPTLPRLPRKDSSRLNRITARSHGFSSVRISRHGSCAAVCLEYSCHPREHRDSFSVSSVVRSFHISSTALAATSKAKFKFQISGTAKSPLSRKV